MNNVVYLSSKQGAIVFLVWGHSLINIVNPFDIFILQSLQEFKSIVIINIILSANHITWSREFPVSHIRKRMVWPWTEEQCPLFILDLAFSWYCT